MTHHKPTKPIPLDLLKRLYQQQPSYLGRTKAGGRVLVRHRHDCQHWSGKRCDCNAVVVRS